MPRQYPQGQAGAQRHAARRGAGAGRGRGRVGRRDRGEPQSVIFPLEQVPEMARGRGVRLQRYKDGGPSDVKTFKGAAGLTWIDAGGRVFTQSMKELAAWRGNRGDAGRVRPDRFLTNNKFGQPVANGRGP